MILIKHFEFSYRHRLAVVLTSVLVSIVAAAGIVSATGLNDNLVKAPPLKPLNTLQRLADEGRVVGELVLIENTNYLVLLPNQKTINVTLTSKTKYSRDKSPTVGDQVVIFGKYSKDKQTFEAYGVRIGPPNVKYRLNKGKDRRFLQRPNNINEIKI